MHVHWSRTRAPGKGVPPDPAPPESDPAEELDLYTTMAGAGEGDSPLVYGDYWEEKPSEFATAPEVATAPELEKDQLSIFSKLCYAMGGFPNQVAQSASSFFLQIYLLEVAHITPFHTSLVIFVGRIWGAAVDPVGAFFITKTKQTRIGHLMPWIVGCTPFLIASYIFMWFTPPFTAGRFAWYLTFHSLYQALSTVPGTEQMARLNLHTIFLFHVPYTALIMFLSKNQSERDSATAYRMTFEVLGMLVGAMLQAHLVSDVHSPDQCTRVNTTIDVLEEYTPPQDNYILSFADHAQKVYMTAAGIVGGFFFIGFLALLFGVKEKADPVEKSKATISFCMGLRLTVRYKAYTKLTGAFILISTAIKIEQGNFVLYCTHTTNLRNHFHYLVVVLLITAVASTPFWQWFLVNFGKKRAACGISWMIPFAILLVTIPNDILAYFAAFVCGLSISASLLLPWSMLPDVIDHFRQSNPDITGQETIFYSSYIFFTKISAGFGLGLSAAGLQVSGYISGACKQVAPVILMLKLLVSAVPAALIAMGLLILYFYPVGKENEVDYGPKNKRKIKTDQADIQNISVTEENTQL